MIEHRYAGYPLQLAYLFLKRGSLDQLCERDCTGPLGDRVSNNSIVSNLVRAQGHSSIQFLVCAKADSKRNQFHGSLMLCTQLPDCYTILVLPRAHSSHHSFKIFQPHHQQVVFSQKLTIDLLQTSHLLLQSQLHFISSRSNLLINSTHIAFTNSIIITPVIEGCHASVAAASGTLCSSSRGVCSSIRSSVATCRLWYGLTRSAAVSF